MNALADYEDLEEQGRLLILPYKVGTTVYHINSENIIEYKVTGYSVGFMPNQLFIYLGNRECTTDNMSIDEAGKTLFLNREEAEKKLKEME